MGTSEQENLKAIRLHYAAFSSGDIDGIIAGLDPSVRILVSDEHGLPEREKVEGHAGARVFFETIADAITHTTLQIGSIRADGDRVLANVTIGGTVRSTGDNGTIPAVHLFKLRDGLITQIRTHRPDWHEYESEHGTPPG